MTPDLIARLLQQPLPVRLALLDAEPNGPGWYVATFVPEVFASPEWFGRDALTQHIRNGAAWLPCNPLAIVEHAERLHISGSLKITRDDTIGWRFDLMVIRNGEELPACSGEHKNPHTAAIALLREVVNG